MVLYSNASVVGYPYNYCVNSLAKRALTYQCQTSNLYCAINSYNSTNKQYITYYNIYEGTEYTPTAFTGYFHGSNIYH